MRVWACYAAFALMLGGTMNANASPALAENVLEGGNILSLQASYPIPNELTHGSAWAHDYHRFTFATGSEVLIFDTRDPESRPKSLSNSIGPVAFSFIAWSPDDELIAVSQGGGNKFGISIYRVADGRLLAQRLLKPSEDGDYRNFKLEQDFPYREFFMGQGPVTFNLDGTSLWVSHPTLLFSNPLPFVYAVRLRLPDLEVVDEIKIEPPVEGRPVLVLHPHIDATAGRPVLTLAVWARMPSKGAPIFEPFAYAFDLETKAEVFPHFRLSNENRSGFFRLPEQIHVLRDPSLILVRLTPAVGTRPGVRSPPGIRPSFRGLQHADRRGDRNL